MAVATDLANLTGRVFDDFSGDGFTAGEEVAGAALDLFRDDGDGIFEPNAGDTEIRMTTSDSNGNYVFTRVESGSYFVLQPAQTIGGRTLAREVSSLITVTPAQVAGRLITTIDGFDQTFQSVRDETNDGAPVTSTQAAPEAIGGSRDLLVSKTSDIGAVELIVNDPVSPNLLQVRSDAFGGGRRVVIWDGAGDDPAVVDAAGLGARDLTGAGEAEGLRLVVGADLPGGQAIVRLYSPGAVSQATLLIPQLTTQPTSVEFLPFSAFSAVSGGGADLTSIGAIEFEVVAGPNYDALADLIGTIGPNVIPAADFDNFETIDLSLQKATTTTNATVNGPVSFQITLRNEGPDTATGIVVTDTFPSGITYQSNTASSGTFNPANGQWSVPALGPNAIATLNLTGLLTSTDTQTNRAAVIAVEQFDVDSTPDNNVLSEDDEDTATITASQIDLAIDKTISNARPNVGQSVTFSISLSNTGADTATGIVVRDVLPSGLSLTGNTPSTGSFNTTTSQWTVPSLVSGGSATLTLVANVNAAGSFTNVAEVIAADQFDTDSTPGNGLESEDDQDSVTLQTPSADLSLEKSVSSTPVSIGDSVTFTILVRNAGPDPATGVRVQDVLPTGLTYLSDSVNSGSYNPSTGEWVLDPVPVNAATPATLNITARVDTAGTKTNTAQIIAAEQQDPDSTPGSGGTTEDDIDSVSLTPVTIDLQLTKTANLDRVSPTDTIQFTLTATNTSSSQATNIVVLDSLPAGLSLQTFSASGGTYTPSTGRWEINAIPAGSSQTLTINASLNPSRSDLLAAIGNQAEIIAADQFDIDSTPGNNVASEDDQASVTVTPARADLSLAKNVNTTEVNVGDNVTFTLVARNDGPDPSDTFVVSDPLPAGATYISDVPSQGDYDPATQRWTVPSLPSGQTANLQLVLQATSTGIVNNSAEIVVASLPDPDSTPGNANASEDDQADAQVVAQQIDLRLSKTVQQTQQRLRQPFDYTITVTNEGADDATGVVIAEQLPAGLTLVRATPGRGSYSTSTDRWSLGSLASGESATLTLRARVDSISSATANQFTNTAQVFAADQVDADSTPGNNDVGEDDHASQTITIPIADLRLTQSVDVTNPNVNDPVVLEVVVNNDGPDDATNVVIENSLPTGLSFQSNVLSAGTYEPSSGRWMIPSLASGASATLQLFATVVNPGTVAVTAEVIEADQDDLDSTPDNAVSTEDDQSSVSISTPVIDLSLEKTAEPQRPAVNSELVYVVTIRNAGPDNATGVQVRDVLPSGFRFTSSTPIGQYNETSGIWEVGQVAAGASRELILRGTVTDMDTLSQFENQAEVIAADQFDSDSVPDSGFGDGEDDVASVQVTPASSDLELTKSVDSNSPNVGDEVTFTVSIVNNGPDAAESIEVSDELPTGLTYVRDTTSLGTYNSGTQRWVISRLESGQTATLSLTAIVGRNAITGTTQSTLVNTAEILTSSQRDPDSVPGNGVESEDDLASVSLSPQLVDLALTKTIDDARPNLNDTVTYELVATNDGPSTATGIQVRDQLPAGLTFVSSSSTSGGYSSSTGIWSIPTLPSGQSATLTLRANLSPSNLGDLLNSEIVNRAEIVAADQPDDDSVPDNNIASEDDQAEVALTLQRADLSLTKTVNNDNPNQNDAIEFLVQVTNAGPDPATSIVVRDVLPIGLQLTGNVPTRGSFNSATSRWTIDRLEVGQSATLQLNARVTTSNVLINAAEIVSVDQLDPNSSPGNAQSIDEDDNDSVQVSPRVVDLSVQSSITPTEAQIGDVVRLTVMVGNGTSGIDAVTGARTISPASGVVVQVPIPIGLSFVAGGPTLGLFDPATGRWEVGELAVGQTEQLQIDLQVDQRSVFQIAPQVFAVDQFDVDSVPANDELDEDDQDQVQLLPPRILNKRMFLAR